MKNSRKLFCIMATAVFVIFLMSAAITAAQGGGPKLQFMKNGQPDVNAQLNFVFKTGPKGTAHADATGMAMIPADVLSSNKPHTQMTVYECPDGTLYAVEEGADSQVPCPKEDRKRLGVLYLDEGGTKVFHESGGATTGGIGHSSTGGGTSMIFQVDTGAGVALEGGNAFEYYSYYCTSGSGTTCSKSYITWKAGVDAAFLFPFWGGSFSAGPVVGAEWRGDITTQFTGTDSGVRIKPQSTSGTETEKLRVNTPFLFGGRVAWHPMGSHLGGFVEGGESVQSIRFTDTYSDETDMENYVFTAPFVGVGGTWFLSKHVGATAQYRYFPIKYYKDTCSDCTGDEISVHDNDLLFGFTFTWGGGN